MLERRDSKMLSYRKKRRHDWPWPIIIGLFAVGVILVILAFAFRDDESKTPDVQSREIKAHASAKPSNNPPEPPPQVEQEPDPEPIEPSEPPEPPQQIVQNDLPEPPESNAPTEPQFIPVHDPQPEKVEAAPLEGPAAVAAAMANFARLPVAKGAAAPRLGRYKIVDTPIAYDKNASAEEILRAQSKAYVVVSGDILGRIAQKNGCTIEQLKAANRMTNDQIKIGQKLLIPKCKDESGEAKDITAIASNAPAETPDVPAAPTAPRGRWWKRTGVNTTALPKLLSDEGFKPPQKFRAFVLELTFDDTRQVVTRERAFDYKGTSASHTGWNPASTVKIFAAIGALRRVDELGFTSRAKITFHGKKTYSSTVGALIEAAIIQSDNIAYNRVVQLASFDKLHKEILTDKFGITQTALNRAYQLSTWQSLGEDPSFRVSPSITLSEGKKKVTLPAANSKANAVCSSSACTSLQDLAECSRRLMLQEQLPANESFNLKHEDLIVLRRAMRSADRTRGTEIVDRFASVFADNRVKFYSKPGFSEDWFTDNVYIFDPRYNQAWIVVMSGYPGRSSLNSAATAIAKIISSGKLRKIQ